MHNIKEQIIKQRIFLEMDELLIPMLQGIAEDIKHIKEGLDDNHISVATGIKGDKYLGEPLIDIMSKMSTFLDSYKEIKDTWCVINT
jgi:hypothetical protein